MHVHSLEIIDQISRETCWKFDLLWTEKPEEFVKRYENNDEYA